MVFTILRDLQNGRGLSNQCQLNAQPTSGITGPIRPDLVTPDERELQDILGKPRIRYVATLGDQKHKSPLLIQKDQI